MNWLMAPMLIFTLSLSLSLSHSLSHYLSHSLSHSLSHFLSHFLSHSIVFVGRLRYLVWVYYHLMMLHIQMEDRDLWTVRTVKMIILNLLKDLHGFYMWIFFDFRCFMKSGYWICFSSVLNNWANYLKSSECNEFLMSEGFLTMNFSHFINCFTSLRLFCTS